MPEFRKNTERHRYEVVEGGQVVGHINYRQGADGVVDQVSYGTRMGHDLQFYRDIPIQPTGYGQSMTLLLLVEALNHAPA